jgi:hypothetical protein
LIFNCIQYLSKSNVKKLYHVTVIHHIVKKNISIYILIYYRRKSSSYLHLCKAEKKLNKKISRYFIRDYKKIYLYYLRVGSGINVLLVMYINISNKLIKMFIGVMID